MKTIKLITCKDTFQAHVIQGALQNEGIASILHNENMSGIMQGYTCDTRFENPVARKEEDKQ
ncbi:Protein of uncharacterised function (DUF2007) [Bacteroides heparinolyticus]|uniref:Protein of uncharacterized function (DUF2007) n=1 Tax=Prevotella heparinolytica TaxID=28113 RepID=A0A449I2B3_9BACE|nr:Protein of uncharacterised function (DUF2007) [Bacteroides heparinolyticus]